MDEVSPSVQGEENEFSPSGEVDIPALEVLPPTHESVQATEGGKEGGNREVEEKLDKDGRPKRLKMTVEAKEYHGSLAKAECACLLKRLERQKKCMCILMELVHNKEKLEHEAVEYDRTFSDLVDAYTRYIELSNSEQDKIIARQSLDELDSSIFDFKERIYTWMSSIKEPSLYSSSSSHRTSSSKGSGRSKVSKKSDRSAQSKTPEKEIGLTHEAKAASVKSFRSSVASNVSQRSYVDLRAEAAGLKAEASMLKRKREAELEAKLLEYDQKIQRVEAMEKVYFEEEGRKNERKQCELEGKEESKSREKKKKTKNKEDLKEEQKKENKLVKESEGIKKEEDRGSRETMYSNREGKADGKGAEDFDRTVLQVLQLQSAPKVDIDVFSGEILEYQYFVETFREVVERVIPDERGRLTRLIQSTAGEAKEVIKHCIHGNRDSCYTHAMSLLKKHFGDPHRIASAYLKELRGWPELQPNDSSEFRTFNQFLIKYKIYKNEQYLRELDAADTLRTLVLKLPLNLQDKWNRKVDGIRTREARIAEFCDFSDFIDVEARLTNDRLYSREALHGTSNAAALKEIKTLATQIGDSDHKVCACCMCGGKHDLEECEEYKGLSRSARMKYLYNNRLCYSCYERMGIGHKSQTCTKKRICTICKEQHPTGLHKHEETISTRSTISGPSSSDNIVSMCVIPVRLSHRSCPEKEVTVYAVLDDCSKGTFVLESVISDLDVPELGSKPAIIKTMIGSVREQIMLAHGLRVRGSIEHFSNYPSPSVVSLPDTVVRPMIPIEEEEFPTPDRVRPWKHLDSIVEKLASYDPTIPVGILIGANCPKALEPHEVISSADDGPYVIRAQLGWCVVGPLAKVNKQDEYSIPACRTTIDVSTNSISKHYFATPKEEDTSIKGLLAKLYDSEFSDTRNERRSLSQEDRKFIAINGGELPISRWEVPVTFAISYPCSQVSLQ